jgi:hypothetical protein
MRRISATLFCVESYVNAKHSKSYKKDAGMGVFYYAFGILKRYRAIP